MTSALIRSCTKPSIWFLVAVIFVSRTDTVEQGKIDVNHYREVVKNMFYHAYDSYIHHAYPYDELRPLTCDGHDTWGSYSLTLIDALDTLAVMGNDTEFQRVCHLLIDKAETFFDMDINVSVFETNIRVVGGLLSAHLLMKRMGMVVEPGWPCSGPLLRMAEHVARKLLPAFDTPTGMPYGTVNLRHGVPKGETTVTCTAGVGTFIVEFGALSRLTGDPVYEKVAMRAIRALWKFRSPIGLLGNHVDVATGKWTALDSGIGGGVDSYFEYLVKGSFMLNIPELLQMFREYEKHIVAHVKRDDWYLWANMKKGGITLPLFTSLDAYWPGIQLIESIMYLHRATQDPFLLSAGVDIVEAIERIARTSCGYATVKDVRDHSLENRMESFFLAETTKYLYLLFDPHNFLHNNGSHGHLVHTPSGDCVVDAGGYVFNTEAHPIDLAAVHCCSAQRQEEEETLRQFHHSLNLMELLDIGQDAESRIVGRKLRRRKKQQQRRKRTEEEEEGRAEEDGSARDESSERGMLGQPEGPGGRRGGEPPPSSATAGSCQNQARTAEEEAASSSALPHASIKTTIIKTESASPPEKPPPSSSSSSSQGAVEDPSPSEEGSGGLGVKVNSQQVALESGSRQKHTLDLAQQILDLFSSISSKPPVDSQEEEGEEEGEGATREPSVVGLYLALANYSIEYPRNPGLMRCPAQSFHSRLAVWGEMFDSQGELPAQ